LLFSQMGRAEMRRRLVDMYGLVKEAVHEMKSDTEGRIIQWNFEPLAQLMGDHVLLLGNRSQIHAARAALSRSS